MLDLWEQGLRGGASPSSMISLTMTGSLSIGAAYAIFLARILNVTGRACATK